MKFSERTKKDLNRACKEFRVKELYIFGSAARGNLSADSDLDFLVKFDQTGFEGAFDQFTGFKKRLEEIFEKPVDLITVKRFRNPIFQEEVDKSKTLLYAA